MNLSNLSLYCHSDAYQFKDSLEAQRQNDAWDRDLRIEERVEEILDSSEEFERVLERFSLNDHLWSIYVLALREAASGNAARLMRHLKAAAFTLAVQDVEGESK